MQGRLTDDILHWHSEENPCTVCWDTPPSVLLIVDSDHLQHASVGHQSRQLRCMGPGIRSSVKKCKNVVFDSYKGKL